MTSRATTAEHPWAIWGFAFGYFACYAPYSLLTKALSSGVLSGGRALNGFEILPYSTLASLVGMVVFLFASGWWKAATRQRVLGLSLPLPTRWTFLSGLCTAAIIATTTLSYSFENTSIVFMMLLMRGGVLIIAPVADYVSKRPVRWTSWVALALSLGAVVVASAKREDLRLSLVALVDVVIYLAGYFFRLRFMTHLAKGDAQANRRYFVEEQMVATPAVVLALGLAALLGQGPLFDSLRSGFGDIEPGRFGLVVLIGLFSQGTGVFGALILLDARENSFCVPVNRASSILAGVLATGALWLFLGAKPVSPRELVGAGLVIAAIVVLTLRPAAPKRA